MLSVATARASFARSGSSVACLETVLLMGVGLRAIADMRVGAGGGATVGNGSCDWSCAGLIIGGPLDVQQDVHSGPFHRRRRSPPRGRELDPRIRFDHALGRLGERRQVQPAAGCGGTGHDLRGGGGREARPDVDECMIVIALTAAPLAFASLVLGG